MISQIFYSKLQDFPLSVSRLLIMNDSYSTFGNLLISCLLPFRFYVKPILVNSTCQIAVLAISEAPKFGFGEFLSYGQNFPNQNSEPI